MQGDEVVELQDTLGVLHVSPVGLPQDHLGAEELQLKPSLLPASVYRSSLGRNHTRLYMCYLGLL